LNIPDIQPLLPLIGLSSKPPHPEPHTEPHITEETVTPSTSPSISSDTTIETTPEPSTNPPPDHTSKHTPKHTPIISISSKTPTMGSAENDTDSPTTITNTPSMTTLTTTDWNCKYARKGCPPHSDTPFSPITDFTSTDTTPDHTDEENECELNLIEFITLFATLTAVNTQSLQYFIEPNNRFIDSFATNKKFLFIFCLIKNYNLSQNFNLNYIFGRYIQFKSFFHGLHIVSS